MLTASLHSRWRRRIARGLILAGCFAPGLALLARAEEAAKKESAKAEPAKAEAAKESYEDEESATTYRNWVDFGVGGLIVNGDRPQFMQRNNIKYGPSGGIEDLHWEQAINKDVSFQMDGRAMFDNKDYALRFEVVRSDVGYFRGGFKQIRMWNDGSGGFFPPSDTWLHTFDNELALDRGEIWFEAGLTLEDKPKVTVKYTQKYRDGTKGSTIWGDSNLTSPGPAPSTPVNLRGIAPSFWDINERHHLINIDVQHKLGKTDYGVGVGLDLGDDNNALKTERRPGEGLVYDRYLTSRERVQSDLYNVHAFTETRLNKQVYFTTGYSFTKLDTDLSGSRVYGDAYDVGYRSSMAYAQGFDALAGAADMNQHVVNLNLMYTPYTNFTIVPSLRVERTDIDSWSAFELTGPGASTPLTASSVRGLINVGERLEARYSGVTNWVFYARGDWGQQDGELEEHGGNGPLMTSSGISRITDDQSLSQRYTAGINWYPSRRINFDLQYYHKLKENTYDHQLDSTPNDSGNRYPAYFLGQDFETDDVNFRINWRLLNNLSLVSRYDLQYSTVASTPDPISGLSAAESARVRSHLFGESLTWIPWSRLYLQGSFNYVLDKTDTRADEYTPAVADARNDYLTASFTSGFVVDNKTDLQAHYFYYRANNFVGDPAFGQPYGADAAEHGATLTLTRRLNKHLRWTMKYGYFNYVDHASGGNNNFDAHMVYSGLHCRF